MRKPGGRVIKTNIDSILKLASILAVLFLILGFKAHSHCYWSNDWLSNVFFVFFGVLASAIMVIFGIKIELSRRASIANPVLRQLLRDNIIRMAYNFDHSVVGKPYSIEDNWLSSRNVSGNEDKILNAMNTLHNRMKEMSVRELNPDEKKGIREAISGFCNDIAHILKRLDYVLDKVEDTKRDEQFVNYIDNLETYQHSIRQILHDSEKKEYESSLLGKYTASFDICVNIYKIVVDALKG